MNRRSHVLLSAPLEPRSRFLSPSGERIKVRGQPADEPPCCRQNDGPCFRRDAGSMFAYTHLHPVVGHGSRSQNR
jgi:hypothetical protein